MSFDARIASITSNACTAVWQRKQRRVRVWQCGLVPDCLNVRMPTCVNWSLRRLVQNGEMTVHHARSIVRTVFFLRLHGIVITLARVRVRPLESG
jgi:hypothetical protein